MNINIKIKQLKSVNNPKSIHGIYPYRGKISAIDAVQVIQQLPKDLTVLDPFCGSGTIVYESAKLGHKTYGIDKNPVALYITKGKVNQPSNLENVMNEFDEIIKKCLITEDIGYNSSLISKFFHKDTAQEVLKVSALFDDMSDYLRACYLGAFSLTARGCNNYKWTSSVVGKDMEEKRYINFYEKMKSKIKKHYSPINNSDVKIFDVDSRILSSKIEPNSVDFVFTSPPYFDCLDYTAYYAQAIYEVLGYNRQDIKVNLIQSYRDYKEDMVKVLNELYKVCKIGAKVIFVVGDKKIHSKVINGADFFNEFSPFKKVEVYERTYSGTSSQIFDKLNKTIRKEQIIIWEK